MTFVIERTSDYFDYLDTDKAPCDGAVKKDIPKYEMLVLKMRMVR